MINSATRYLIRETIGPVLLATFVFSGIIWLTQSLRMLDLMINQGQGFGTYMQMTLLFQLGVLPALLPLAFLIGLLYTLQKLIADSELVVLFAAGLSRWKVATPFLMLAGAICAIVLLFTVWIMPWGLQTFRDKLITIRADVAASAIREGTFSNPINGITVYVRDRTSDGTVRGILVQDSRDEKTTVTYLAESGIITNDADGPRLTMYNGNIQRTNRALAYATLDEGDEARRRNAITYLYFDKYTYDLSQYAPAGKGGIYEPRERYLGDLFFASENDPYLQHKQAEERRKELIAEGHDRFVSVLYPMMFALIALAALLPAPFNRGGYSFRVLAAALLAVIARVAGFGISSLSVETTALAPLAYLWPLLVSGVAIFELSTGAISHALDRRRSGGSPEPEVQEA